ncbi:MAG: hypothetical protein Q4E37_07075 [Tissierellia bacterium]|nr:hypothetical protein [Tissierellia bacterium]
MDEEKIKQVILKILQEKMAPDLVFISLKKERTRLGQAFLESARQFGLEVQEKDFKEDFLLPKRALYLSGLDLEEGVKILLSQEEDYKRIRDLGKKCSVFLEIDSSGQLPGPGKDLFLEGLASLLKAQGLVALFNPVEKVKEGSRPKGPLQDLRGKKILSLRDLNLRGSGQLLVDPEAKLTMALEDALRDRHIQLRRI